MRNIIHAKFSPFAKAGSSSCFYVRTAMSCTLKSKFYEFLSKICFLNYKDYNPKIPVTIKVLQNTCDMTSSFINSRVPSSD